MREPEDDPLGVLMDKILYLSKREAAIRQIDAAIDAYFRGDFDIAITLAGAADGMKEKKPSDLFQQIIDRRPAGMDRSRAISNFNSARDWLKHVTENQDVTRGFTFFESGMFILLAAHKWTHEAEHVHAFASVWFFAIQSAAADGTFSNLTARLSSIEASAEDP